MSLIFFLHKNTSKNVFTKYILSSVTVQVFTSISIIDTSHYGGVTRCALHVAAARDDTTNVLHNTSLISCDERRLHLVW